MSLVLKYVGDLLVQMYPLERRQFLFVNKNQLLKAFLTANPGAQLRLERTHNITRPSGVQW